MRREEVGLKRLVALPRSLGRPRIYVSRVYVTIRADVDLLVHFIC